MNERDFAAALRRYLHDFERHDIQSVQALLAEPRRPRRPHRLGRSLLASVGACMVVAAVVGIMLAPRWTTALRGAETPAGLPGATAPGATPSPTAAPSLLVQDARTGIWTPGNSRAHEWTRLDWAGRKLGAIHVASSGPVFPSPDGSLLVSGERDGLSFFSGTTGQTVGNVTLGAWSSSTLPVWADDSRHVCLVHPTPAGSMLSVVAIDPGADVQQRTVPIPDLQPGRPSVAGCSMRTDRAVLSSFVLSADGSLSPAGGFAVIRLSDGRQLLRRDYREPAPFFNVTVSADARYLVGSPQADTSQARSRVLDLTTGREVAQVDGYGLGFSSDDRFLAVSSRRLPATTVPGGTTGRLVDWRTGRTVWQGQGELDVLGYDLASPAIAVQLASSDAPPPDHDRYLIVRPDGISVTIKQDGNITPTG